MLTLTLITMVEISQCGRKTTKRMYEYMEVVFIAFCLGCVIVGSTFQILQYLQIHIGVFNPLNWSLGTYSVGQ